MAAFVADTFANETDPDLIPVGHEIIRHPELEVYASAEIVTSRAKVILDSIAFPLKALSDRVMIKYTADNDVIWREAEDYFIGRVRNKEWGNG